MTGTTKISPVATSGTLRNGPNIGSSAHTGILTITRGLSCHVGLATDVLGSNHDGVVRVVIGRFSSPFCSGLIRSLIARAARHKLAPFIRRAQCSPSTTGRTLTGGPFSNRLFSNRVVRTSNLGTNIPLSTVGRNQPLILVSTYRRAPAFSAIGFPGRSNTQTTIRRLVRYKYRHVTVINSKCSPQARLTRIRDSDKLHLHKTDNTLLSTKLPCSRSAGFVNCNDSDNVRTNRTVTRTVLTIHTRSTSSATRSCSSSTARTRKDAPTVSNVFYVGSCTTFKMVQNLTSCNVHIPSSIGIVNFSNTATNSCAAPALDAIRISLSRLTRFTLSVVAHHIRRHSRNSNESSRSTNVPTAHTAVKCALIPHRSAINSTGEWHQGTKVKQQFPATTPATRIPYNIAYRISTYIGPFPTLPYNNTRTRFS